MRVDDVHESRGFVIGAWPSFASPSTIPAVRLRSLFQRPFLSRLALLRDAPFKLFFIHAG